MKKTILHTIIGFALSASLFAGPAADIAKKHAAASASELEAYLKANPKAEDKEEAIQHLLMAYDLTGNTQKSTELLKQKFQTLKAGADLDPRELYITTRTLFEIMLASGDKEGAKKLISEAKAKSAGSQMESQLGQAFSQMQGQLNSPVIGDTLELKFTSLQGKEVDLAAMKGKVVLVDFWATWCGPCIAELPNVVKAYEKYHKKGFEVIGISLDKEGDKEKLESFIKEHNMPWAQQFDGKGWQTENAQKYGITGIPATFLIGPDGKVVATNLRGEALEQKIAKHLPK